jgi:FkbM family methyltransferase
LNCVPHITIPGTNHRVLRGDSALTAAAMKSGRLVNEVEIEALGEVRSIAVGDVVLDIGAFVGDTARLFLDLGAEVYAFEPYPDAFACLAHNCPDSQNYNVAVGDGTPMRAMGVKGENSSNFGTRMMSAGGSVPTMRIDDYRFPRVDFVKIDTEGCEVLALRGMRDTLARCKPMLLIEAYDTLLHKQGFTRRQIFDELIPLGFTYRVAIGNESNDRCDLLFNFHE